MEKKTFFQKREPEEIQETLKLKAAYTPHNLVAKIYDLNPDTDAIEVRTPIIPLEFLRRNTPDTLASRKHYRHGWYLPLNQPQGQQAAYEYPYTPLINRMQSLEVALRDLKEEQIWMIGLRWFPVQGKDRRWRKVPFDAVIEGTKIYAYASQVAGKITVDDRYVEANIVQSEGAKLLCKVPSRTKRKQRYGLFLQSVPLTDSKEKKAIIWGLKSQYEDGKEPLRMTFLHNLRYEDQQSRRGSDVFTFGPHEIAAYLAVIRKYWNGKDNTVPLEMNPFPLPSRQFATEYAEKLDNNVLVVDSSTRRLRNLHLDEKCVMLARAIKFKGVWETVFWDGTKKEPEEESGDGLEDETKKDSRDGLLRDYWK